MEVSKMPNVQVKKYDPQQEFAVDKVYRKLTQGIDSLPAEEAVDGLLHGADCLRKGIAQVIERIFEGAEEKQAVVAQAKVDQWSKATEQVKQAIGQAKSTGDYESVEQQLREATRATIAAKESVSKMAFIKKRGQTEYNPAKELSVYLRELEDVVRREYNGSRLLEGEILPTR